MLIYSCTHTYINPQIWIQTHLSESSALCFPATLFSLHMEWLKHENNHFLFFLFSNYYIYYI